jgi:hypothetical protein
MAINYTQRNVQNLEDGSALDPRKLGNKTGTVDMVKYKQWLETHGYTF